MNERELLLLFSGCEGLGARCLAKLMNVCGGLAAIAQHPELWAKAPGIGPRRHQLLTEAFRRRLGAEIEEQCQETGIRALTQVDDDYPQRLHDLYDPPPAIFVRGSMEALRRPVAAAVIGTRRPTPYGVTVARQLGRELSGAGATVVSGLARGIDGAAHLGAVEGGGPTVAVLGAGLDRLYPAEHYSLTEAILAHGGALLSEQPPGRPPLRGNFPARNRLIAALSAIVVVVEAGRRSGALITVGEALELGREVWAVPGPINRPESEGTNRLIADGARPLLNVEEPLAELGLRAVGQPEITGDNEADRMLKALLGHAPTADELALSLRLPAGRVMALLGRLEAEGAVERLPGGRFVSFVRPRSRE
ncbi:MAG: DNA-processing protein DprA [Bacillota bacterium]